MITGKIILKSATKLTLDQRFGEIAKQAPPPPPPPRIHQQTNVIIPQSRQELFGNKRPVTLSIAQRLKKRSINYRLGLGANVNASRAGAVAAVAPVKPRVFQRLGLGNRRRGRGGTNLGASSYLFGGQSGMGIRLRGQGRIGGTRTFRPRTRGYLNNNMISRRSNYSTRGNRNRNTTRGRRNVPYNNNNNNNSNRFNRTRPTTTNGNRGRGARNKPTNRNMTKESLDTDLDKYMSQTKMDSDAADMNAI